jgi:hypothetical protein
MGTNGAKTTDITAADIAALLPVLDAKFFMDSPE